MALKNRKYLKNGLLSSDFNYDDLADEAKYKYSRNLCALGFYRSSKDFKKVLSIGFYSGANGIQLNSYYIGFFTGTSTNSAIIMPNNGNIFPQENTEWVDVFVSNSQQNLPTTNPVSSNISNAGQANLSDANKQNAELWDVLKDKENRE